MQVKAILLALTAATAAADQPNIDDYVSNSVKYWSDFGDYMAKMLGDTVKIATIAEVPGLSYFFSSQYPSAALLTRT